MSAAHRRVRTAHKVADQSHPAASTRTTAPSSQTTPSQPQPINARLDDAADPKPLPRSSPRSSPRIRHTDHHPPPHSHLPPSHVLTAATEHPDPQQPHPSAADRSKALGPRAACEPNLTRAHRRSRDAAFPINPTAQPEHQRGTSPKSCRWRNAQANSRSQMSAGAAPEARPRSGEIRPTPRKAQSQFPQIAL
jgi:hypothetical protein